MAVKHKNPHKSKSRARNPFVGVKAPDAGDVTLFPVEDLVASTSYSREKLQRHMAIRQATKKAKGQKVHPNFFNKTPQEMSALMEEAMAGFRMRSIESLETILPGAFDAKTLETIGVLCTELISPHIPTKEQLPTAFKERLSALNKGAYEKLVSAETTHPEGFTKLEEFYKAFWVNVNEMRVVAQARFNGQPYTPIVVRQEDGSYKLTPKGQLLPDDLPQIDLQAEYGAAQAEMIAASDNLVEVPVTIEGVDSGMPNAGQYYNVQQPSTAA